MRRYLKSDFAELVSWYRTHGLQVPREEKLSGYGLFEETTAAGFLYITNSSLCFIDGLITNPRQISDLRSQALYEIIKSLSEKAKRMGFTTVLGFTKEPNIIERCVMHGFTEVGQYWLMEKEL